MLPCEYAVSAAAPMLKSVGPIIMGKFDWDVLGSTEHGNLSVLAAVIFTFQQLLDSFLVTEPALHWSVDYSDSYDFVTTERWWLSLGKSSHSAVQFDDYVVFAWSWNNKIMTRGALKVCVNFVFNICWLNLLDEPLFFYNKTRTKVIEIVSLFVKQQDIRNC